MLTDNDLGKFKREGFLLLKGFLSPDEVARYRALECSIGSTDLCSIPELSTFWTDERLLQVAKQLLGSPVTYFGEASYSHRVFTTDDNVGGRLHHDAKGTVEHLFNRQHSPTPEPYPIIRFAFYLQDHARCSGGLKLVPGSHRFDSSDFDETRFSYLDVPSEPGDAVVFCNKILHAAQAIRPRNGPAVCPVEQNSLFAQNPGAFFERPRDRRVIFVDYAGRGDLADIYIKSRALNPASLSKGFAALALGGHFSAVASRADVVLRLDAAVVEAVTRIYAAATKGVVNEEGQKYAMGLPALCRLSQSWSSHFDFVPTPPYGETFNDGLALAMQLAPRIGALRENLQSRRIDKAMTPASASSNSL